MSNVFVRQAIVCSAALGLLAACSDSKTIGGAASDVGSTTAAPTTVPTTAPPTTVAPATVPPTVPTPACADTTEPSGAAVSQTVVDGDWNGDGLVDAGVSWGEPSGGSVTWFMRAEVNGGQSSTVALGELGASYAQALDNVDVDFALGASPGTNRDEILVVVGGWASGLILNIFGVGTDGCIFRFISGEEPFEVAVGGTTGQAFGLRCDGGAGSQFLVELYAQTSDEVNWDTYDYRIERSGDNTLTLGPSLAGSLLATDAALNAYSRAECNGTIFI